MPLVKTTTELQRNMNEVSRLCRETGQPVYITKNGQTELVVMDAQAFDRTLDLRDLAYRREMRTLQGIQQGIDEAHTGLLRPYSDIRAELDL